MGVWKCACFIGKYVQFGKIWSQVTVRHPRKAQKSQTLGVHCKKDLPERA